MHTHTYKIYIPKNCACMLVGIQRQGLELHKITLNQYGFKNRVIKLLILILFMHSCLLPLHDESILNIFCFHAYSEKLYAFLF